MGIVVAYMAILTLLRFTAARKWPYVFPITLQRLGYWWCLVGFVVLSLRFGKIPLVIGIFIASFLALKEYFTVIPTRRSDRVAVMLSYLSIPFVLYYIYIEWYNMFVLTIPVYFFLILPVVLALQPDKTGMVASLGRIAFGVMLLVYCVGYVGYMYVLNVKWFVTVLLLTELADQIQVSLSRLCGASLLPLVPGVNVRKNLSGVLLSSVIVMAICLFLNEYNGWSIAHCVAIGVLIPVLCIIGDLVIFSIRSDLGIEGPAAIVPGRGLILDRMRAICYTAPILFHYLRYFLT